MHAQYAHSPPTSRSSTIATSRPCLARRAAATSPAAPAPITTTSKLRMLDRMHGHTPPGTTGFDVVGSQGWLRVEVPEASQNPGNNKCEEHCCWGHPAQFRARSL